MREYLDALDQAATAEAKPTANPDDDMPPGNLASEPQVTSLTDPAASWTSKGRSKLAFAYGTTGRHDQSRIDRDLCKTQIVRNACEAM